MLNESQSTNQNPDLISIVTCGLHTIHRNFQLGAKIVHGLLVKFCKQHELADYEQIISSTTCSSPFCLHRWLENEYVVKRAESTWDNFISLINYWKILPKSKQLGTGDKSCLKLQESIKYSLIKNQLNWFPYI